jgi:hypothetical protein
MHPAERALISGGRFPKRSPSVPKYYPVEIARKRKKGDATKTPMAMIRL